MLVGTATSAEVRESVLEATNAVSTIVPAVRKYYLAARRVANTPLRSPTSLHAPTHYHKEDMDLLKDLLKPLAEDGAALTREQAADVLRQILSGDAPDVEIAALLTVLATRGEQAPELAGFVDVMRAMRPGATHGRGAQPLVDTCGTGGGGPLTFNISSGAALVAAAAGANVAKHGNRAVTSLAARPTFSKLSAFPSISPRSWPSNASAKPASSSSLRRSTTPP